MLDFRSDTVTKPTPAMADSIARAAADPGAMGDDVLGNDPTVRKLEDSLAAMLEKEAALFVPSGTMGNLLCVRSQTEPGDEVFLHREAHIHYYEGGGYAAVAGVSPKFVGGAAKEDRGVFTGTQLRRAVRPTDDHFPRPRLVCLENTHNRAGGTVWPLETFAETCETARELGLRVHLDGARVWNAAVSLGVPPHEITRHTDTVSACLSKGLGCPVGSVIAGDGPTIERARRFRKMLGGAMRQAGVVAAAGLHALDHHLDRLSEDHANAGRLARGLNAIDGLTVDLNATQTNLVYGTLADDLPDEGAFVRLLAEHGVLILDEGPRSVRFVTHLHLSSGDVDEAIGRVRAALDAWRQR
ncbi:MAG: GntG family PLP-dependent aldolase [Planctomycetota bacterium]